MKIVITGGKGQLGHDCAYILGDEHRVSAFSSRELNIADYAQVAERLGATKPDVVINCAAYTAVDLCESEQEKCWEVNAKGPENLARECKNINAKLIHISTDYVFDGTRKPPRPYNETDPVGPVSQYGKSKLAGEDNIRKIFDKHIIIRTAWLYGINGKNFLKTMLRLASADPNRTLRVVNDQFGSLTWTYGLALQIRHLLDSNLTGTIHATAEGHSTWYEAAVTFLNLMEVPHKIEPCTTADYPTPARRPANSILENQRLKENGLNIMKPWSEDVREFVARHREQLLNEL